MRLCQRSFGKLQLRPNVGRQKKAQCKHCLSIMSASSNSMLKAHIKQKYCKALKNVPEVGQSSMARDGSIFVNDHEAVRQAFAGLVIKRGLPFNH